MNDHHLIVNPPPTIPAPSIATHSFSSTASSLIPLRSNIAKPKRARKTKAIQISFTPPETSGNDPVSQKLRSLEQELDRMKEPCFLGAAEETVSSITEFRQAGIFYTGRVENWNQLIRRKPKRIHETLFYECRLKTSRLAVQCNTGSIPTLYLSLHGATDRGEPLSIGITLSRSMIKISGYRAPSRLHVRLFQNLSKLGRHVQSREITLQAGAPGVVIAVDELFKLGFLPLAQTPQTWNVLRARMLNRWTSLTRFIPAEYTHAGEVRELLQISQNPQDMGCLAQLLNGLEIHRKKETGTLLEHLLESEKFSASLPLAG